MLGNTETTLPSNRDISFDIAKGIAIILMVVGHSGTSNYIKDFIYLFHISAFYFISGYFFNDKYIGKKKLFIKRKILQLYKPFVIYGIIFLILSPLFFKLHIINDFSNKVVLLKDLFGTIIFKHVETLLIPFWFLRSLFTVSIIFLFIRWTFHKYRKKDLFTITSVIILFCIGAFLSIKNIHLPSQIQREILVLFFYASGFYIKKYNINFTSNKYIITSLFIALCILAFFFKIDLVGSYFNNIIGLIVSSYIGIYFLISISKYISKYNYPSNILSTIGRNTIPILALHFLSFKIITLLIVYIEGLPIEFLSQWPTLHGEFMKQTYWWLLYSMIGIIVPLLLSFVKNKIGQKFSK